MHTKIFYGVTIVLLTLSLIKDRGKTKKALIKAWKSLENILPQMLAMIVAIGLIIALLSPETISRIIGGSSGWWGVLLAAILGSVTLMPAFVAFPMAAVLLQNGAGYMQLAAFVSTLTMVGLITFPMEVRFFGRKMTIWRNALAFVFAFLVAPVIGKVVVL